MKITSHNNPGDSRFFFFFFFFSNNENEKFLSFHLVNPFILMQISLFPTALRKAKIAYIFGLSECNRDNFYGLDFLTQHGRTSAYLQLVPKLIF